MSPLILLLGFVVGCLTLRLRTLVLAVVGLGLAWGVLIVLSASLDDLAAACLIGAANAAVGVVVGGAGRLLSLGVSRWPST